MLIGNHTRGIRPVQEEIMEAFQEARRVCKESPGNMGEVLQLIVTANHTGTEASALVGKCMNTIVAILRSCCDESGMVSWRKDIPKEDNSIWISNEFAHRSDGIQIASQIMMHPASRKILYTITGASRIINYPSMEVSEPGATSAYIFEDRIDKNWSLRCIYDEWLRVGEGNPLWKTLYDILIEFADDEALQASGRFHPQDMK